MSKSKKVDVWMPLYIAKYLADTTRLTTEQHGAYLLLIMDYWMGGPPPDVDATLAQVTKLSLGKWRAMRPVLAAKFQIKDGAWHHKRIDLELSKAKEMQAALSERGRAGAAARWGQEETDDDATSNASGNGQSNATGNAREMPKTMLADAPVPVPKPLQGPGPSPSPPPKSDRASRKRSPKTDLPADFTVSERVTTWASGKGFDRLPEHLEAFVSKVRQHGYRYVDWDEAFMCAVREDWARLRNGRSGAANNQAAIDEAARALFGKVERDITGESERL